MGASRYFCHCAGEKAAKKQQAAPAGDEKEAVGSREATGSTNRSSTSPRKMSYIDKRKRAPECAIPTWNVQGAGFYTEALKRDNNRTQYGRIQNAGRVMSSTQELRGVHGRRRSYVDDPRRRITSIDPRYMNTLGPRLFGLPDTMPAPGSPIASMQSRPTEFKSYGAPTCTRHAEAN